MSGHPRVALWGIVFATALGVSGCDSIQGPDEDPASIELAASRTQLDVLGDTIHLTAVVKSSSGEVLVEPDVAWSSRSPAVVSVDGSGVATALANGTGWIVASSGSARDSVRVTVNSAIECSLVGSVGVPDTGTGTLSSSDCEIGGRYIDAWRLTLDEDLQITVELLSDRFDALLVMLNASGEQIALDDDGAGALNARITITLPAGVYFVYATSYGPGDTGEYELNVYEGVAESPCPATASVSFPGTVTGTITADACDFGGNYVDVWRLELARDTVVVLQVDSDDFQPALVLADTTGVFLEPGGEGPGTSAWMEVHLEAGSYDIWLGGQQEARTGAYTLSVRPGPTIRRCEAAGTVTVPDRVSGELTADDCFLFFSPGDPWDLELAETTAVGLAVSSDPIDPVILISDASGDVVDGFSGDESAVEAEITLPAGSYRVWVLADAGAHGSYELVLSRADQLPDCEPDGSIALGDTVQAALAITDCQLPAGRYGDVWTTRVDSASAVTVLLASEKFDPSLVVADSTGSRIERDEGSGGSAGVTMELEPGLYQIWATSREPDRVGAYTLTLTAEIAEAGRSTSATKGADRWLPRRGSEPGSYPWKRPADDVLVNGGRP